MHSTPKITKRQMYFGSIALLALVAHEYVFLELPVWQGGVLGGREGGGRGRRASCSSKELDPTIIINRATIFK